MIKTDMWVESHKFLQNMKVNDSYFSGGNECKVIRKTKKRIHFSNGNCITIKNAGNFYYLSGKNIIQILRDIEGYLIYLKLTT